MPSRLLREGILTSKRVNKLTPEAEIFYRRLMSKVDDYGRYELITEGLPAALYPLKTAYISVNDCVRWLNDCVRFNLVVVYQVGDKQYIQMLDTKWQLRGKPKFPAPEEGTILVQIAAPCTAENESSLSRSRSRVSESESKNKVKNPATAPPAAAAGKEKPVTKEPQPENKQGNSATWVAYAKAYEDRYEVPPLRNAKTNALIQQFVGRVGAEEAPHVAAFYVKTAKWLYVERTHSLDIMVRDAEALRTEWATNRASTRHEAMASDRTQANAKTFGKLIDEAQAGTENVE